MESDSEDEFEFEFGSGKFSGAKFVRIASEAPDVTIKIFQGVVGLAFYNNDVMASYNIVILADRRFRDTNGDEIEMIYAKDSQIKLDDDLSEEDKRFLNREYESIRNLTPKEINNRVTKAKSIGRSDNTVVRRAISGTETSSKKRVSAAEKFAVGDRIVQVRPGNLRSQKINGIGRLGTTLRNSGGHWACMMDGDSVEILLNPGSWALNAAKVRSGPYIVNISDFNDYVETYRGYNNGEDPPISEERLNMITNEINEGPKDRYDEPVRAGSRSQRTKITSPVAVRDSAKKNPYDILSRLSGSTSAVASVADPFRSAGPPKQTWKEQHVRVERPSSPVGGRKTSRSNRLARLEEAKEMMARATEMIRRLEAESDSDEEEETVFPSRNVVSRNYDDNDDKEDDGSAVISSHQPVVVSSYKSPFTAVSNYISPSNDNDDKEDDGSAVISVSRAPAVSYQRTANNRVLLSEEQKQDLRTFKERQSGLIEEFNRRQGMLTPLFYEEEDIVEEEAPEWNWDDNDTVNPKSYIDQQRWTESSFGKVNKNLVTKGLKDFKYVVIYKGTVYGYSNSDIQKLKGDELISKFIKSGKRVLNYDNGTMN